MPAIRQNSLHLCRLAGVDLYVHWSWFLVAVFEIGTRARSYSSPLWNVLEYLALFAIVLTHEFGHVLACRSTGGAADQIMLWPLGGVAYVRPPQRPGAILWSVAAGPLVNVVLMPVFLVALSVATHLGWMVSWYDAYSFLWILAKINTWILLFNLLPVYPLDGGQILRSLLWFGLGRARSLMMVAVLGFLGVAAFIGLALFQQSVWLGLIAAYMGMNCMGAFKQAKALARLEKLPRRAGFACPSCETAPPIGPFWRCTGCGQGFDTFLTGAACPACGERFMTTTCLDCREERPFNQWVKDSMPDGGVLNGGSTIR
jgi:Zn-dependent protease